MNTITKSLSLAASILMFSSQGHTQEVLRVIDNGKDGEIQYYTVICPSGKRTSANYDYADGKVCTMIVNGKQEVCRIGWDVDSAAKEACQ